MSPVAAIRVRRTKNSYAESLPVGAAFSVLVPYGCYPALNFPSSGNGKPKIIPAPKG